MCKTTCDRPLIRATLERKRTSVGETMQQDIDTRFHRLEADKFATAGYVQREKPSVIVAALHRPIDGLANVHTWKHRGMSDEWQSYLLPDSVHPNTYICLCTNITKT